MRAILLAATAAAAVAAFQPVHAQSAEDCMGMLTIAVGSALDREGFDTTNICNLTVGQLAQIRSMLEEDGMSSNVRGSIERILAEAG